MDRSKAMERFLLEKNLALVGVSRSGGGYGNIIRRDLAAKGFNVRVVHHQAETIGGVPCVPSVKDLAGQVGGVVFVTPPDVTLQVMEDVVAAGIRRVWLQQGAESLEVLEFCRQNHIEAVHGICIMVVT